MELQLLFPQRVIEYICVCVFDSRCVQKEFVDNDLLSLLTYHKAHFGEKIHVWKTIVFAVFAVNDDVSSFEKFCVVFVWKTLDFAVRVYD